MSLIGCPKCHSQISDASENCPACGYPISPMARLKSGIQLIEHKKTIVDVQSVYAWITMAIGFILIVALPFDSLERSVNQGLGITFILVGMLWCVFVGLKRWWIH